jgi:hypothetical protein
MCKVNTLKIKMFHFLNKLFSKIKYLKSVSEAFVNNTLILKHIILLLVPYTWLCLSYRHVGTGEAGPTSAPMPHLNQTQNVHCFYNQLVKQWICFE